LANIKSQIKRVKQAEVRQLRNKAVKSELKTLISKFNKTVKEADKKVAEENLLITIKSLDKAASKGIIHKNNAANKKSSLTMKFNVFLEKMEKAAKEAPESIRETVEEKPKTTETKTTTKKTTVKKSTVKSTAKKTAAKDVIKKSAAKSTTKKATPKKTTTKKKTETDKK